MNRREVIATIRAISERTLPGGGFSEHTGSPYRPDATAWAILALNARGTQSNLVDSARSRLASEQFKDGRVSLAQDQAQTFWPTPLAILAWNGSVFFRRHQELAIQFLIHTKGLRFNKDQNSGITTLDTSLSGWPWIGETFSWVEPTALSILALNLSGYGSHERVHEAIRLLLDRQLPSGGWNIGSTIIYGRETYPQLDCTGIALATLAGQVEKKGVERSLNYLKTHMGSCRTPLSLGWTLLGLGGWGERPTEAKKWIIECIARQRKYGTYGTTLLSLLMLAYSSNGGLLETIT